MSWCSIGLSSIRTGNPCRPILQNGNSTSQSFHSTNRIASDLHMIEIQWNPTKRDLRIFAALLIVLSTIAAVILWFRTGNAPLSTSIAGCGTVIGGVGCIRPQAIRWFYLTWITVTFPIGWTVSHLILAVVYYLVLTPIALLLRIGGHDSMKKRWEKTQQTYWEARTKERTPKDYFRQF